MFWFFRKQRAHESTPDELRHALKLLLEEVREVQRRVELLADKHEALEATFKSFRGRVYAWRGRLEVEEPAAPTDLNDPRLSKAEVKKALGLTTPAGVAAYLKGSKPQ